MSVLGAPPPRVVLVGVQLAENLGAAARAMANFGLSELWLVAPEVLPADPRARAMSTHGEGVLAEARVVSTLEEALADARGVWATAALPRAREASVWHPRVLAAHLRAAPGPHALLFGPERTGLSAEHVALADGVVRIPTAPACRALNLAQAVAILSWEWVAAGEAPAPPPLPEPAPRKDFDAFFHTFSHAAVEGGAYPDPERREKALTTLRQALGRARFTAGELGALHGALRAILRGR